MFSHAHEFVQRYVVPFVIGLLCVLAVAVTSLVATPATAYAEVKAELSDSYTPSCTRSSACPNRPANVL